MQILRRDEVTDYGVEGCGFPAPKVSGNHVGQLARGGRKAGSLRAITALSLETLGRVANLKPKPCFCQPRRLYLTLSRGYGKHAIF